MQYPSSQVGTMQQTQLSDPIDNPAAGVGNEIGVCKYNLILNPGPHQSEYDPHIIIIDGR